MIVVFYTEAEAVAFSKKIHIFLIENRKDYNAERWSNINKSDNEDKWYVKLPYDFKSLNFEIDSKIEMIDKLPDNWKNNIEETEKIIINNA